MENIQNEIHLSTDTSIKGKIKDPKSKKELFRDFKIHENLTVMSITKILLYIDNYASKSQKENAKKNFEKIYENLVKKAFKIGELETSIFLYSIILAKRAAKSIRKICQFHSGQFYSIYCGCLFITIKFLVDHELWKTSDFSCICGLDVKEIKDLEKNLLTFIFEFRVYFKEEEFQKQFERFMYVYENFLEGGIGNY